MKALRFSQYGPPSVLSMEEIPAPQPSPGEVLVRVQASSINPLEIVVVAGNFKSKLPMTPGRDFAGVVIQGGNWEGREVWGSGAGFGISRPGSHAEFITLPATWLSEKPANLTMHQAASVGVPYSAAWQSLVEVGQLQKRERVLITGANGAVGRAATQIAHWRGAYVIGADLNETPTGTDAFIHLGQVDLPSEVRRITQEQGVDVVLDTVGGNLFESCLRTLRPGGKHVAIASAGRAVVEFNLMDFYRNQSRLFGVDTTKLTGIEIASVMNRLREGFEQNFLKPPVVQVNRFADAIAVYQSVADRSSKGKQVLAFTE
jgi:NADPH:quinone reductase